MKKVVVIAAIILILSSLAFASFGELSVGISPYTYQGILIINPMSVLSSRYGCSLDISYGHEFSNGKTLTVRATGEWFNFADEVNEYILHAGALYGGGRDFKTVSMFYDFGLGTSVCFYKDQVQLHLNMIADIGLSFPLGSGTAFVRADLALTPQVPVNLGYSTFSLFLRPVVGMKYSL